MATIITKTIKSSGGDYTSLSAWEAALGGATSGDLVSNDEAVIAECYSFDDTTPCTINGFTGTDATRNVTIRAAAGNRHNGVFYEDTANGYRLVNLVSTTANLLIEDIEFKRATTKAVDLSFGSYTSSSDVTLRRCIIQSTATGTNYAIASSVANLNLTLENCIIKSAERGIDTRSALSATINNCTFHVTGDLGLVCDSELTCKNTVVVGTSNQDFWTGGASPSGSNNASEDTTATVDYTSSVTGVSLTDGADFTAPSTRDYSVVSGGKLENAGTDLSGTFTDDIAGNIRS